MLRRSTALALFLISMLLLAACGQPGQLGTAPTPISTPTTGVPSTPTTSVPSTPTTAPTVTSANEAPTFAQIRAEIAKLQTQPEGAYEAIQTYIKSLEGKIITNRDGWLASLPVEQGDDTLGASVFLEDPYSAAALSSQKDEGGDLTAVLTPFPAALMSGSYSGMHLLFSGKITTGDAFMDVALTIETTSVTLVDKPMAVPAGTPQALPTSAVPGTTPVAADGVVQGDVVTNLEGQETDIVAYLASLEGKTVKDWQVWVVGGADGKWQIVLTDPYSTESPANKRQAAPSRGDSRTLVIITLETPASAPALRLGQMVRVSGTLHNSTVDYPPSLTVSANDATMVEDRLAGLTTPADLQGVVMGVGHTVCFGTCPDYTLTVYGNGVVVYQGNSFVNVYGTRIFTVSEETVRALLAQFTKAGYFDLAAEYTDYTVSDMPYTNTTFTYGGKTKTINHYHGDNSAPARLDILEASFAQLIDVSALVGGN